MHTHIYTCTYQPGPEREQEVVQGCQEGVTSALATTRKSRLRKDWKCLQMSAFEETEESAGPGGHSPLSLSCCAAGPAPLEAKH